MPRKRADNEGTVTKRTDGRWEARLRADGKRKCFYGATQREVIEKLAAAKVAKAKGLTTAPERLTVGQFLTDWLEHTVKPSTRSRTHESYELIVRRHLIPEVGKIPLNKLNPIHVQGLVAKKSKEGLSPRTVTYVKSVLGRGLNYALRLGLIARNVAGVVPSPKSQPKELKFLTTEEATKLLAALKGDRLEALFTVALAMGLRRGEALGLKWSDIDWVNGSLVIVRQLQRIGGELTVNEPKTRSGRRVLSLPVFATESLKEHQIRQLESRFIAGDLWEDTGFVFTTELGKPIDPRNVIRHFTLLLERYELPHMRFHDLRHTCASLLLAQNVNPRVVMEILGHSQISLTMDLYSHVMPSIKKDAADSLDSLFSGKKSAS